MKSHIVIVLLWSCKDLICCPKAAQLPHGYLINEKIKVTPLKFSGSLAFADFMVWSSFFFSFFFSFFQGSRVYYPLPELSVTAKNAHRSTPGRNEIYIQLQSGQEIAFLCHEQFWALWKSSIPKGEEKIISHSMDCHPSLPFLSPKSQMVQIQTFYLYKLWLLYFDFLPLQYAFTCINSVFAIENQDKSKILHFILLKSQSDTLTILGHFVPCCFFNTVETLTKTNSFGWAISFSKNWQLPV